MVPPPPLPHGHSSASWENKVLFTHLTTLLSTLSTISFPKMLWSLWNCHQTIENSLLYKKHIYHVPITCTLRDFFNHSSVHIHTFFYWQHFTTFSLFVSKFLKYAPIDLKILPNHIEALSCITHIYIACLDHFHFSSFTNPPPVPTLI